MTIEILLELKWPYYTGISNGIRRSAGLTAAAIDPKGALS